MPLMPRQMLGMSKVQKVPMSVKKMLGTGKVVVNWSNWACALILLPCHFGVYGEVIHNWMAVETSLFQVAKK